MQCFSCKLPTGKNFVIPCRCKTPYHQTCLTSARIESSSALSHCEQCKTTYFFKKVSMTKVLQPLIRSFIRAVGICIVSIIILHWNLFNLTMNFHHCMIVNLIADDQFSYKKYVNTFILENDPLLLSSYVQISGFVAFYYTYFQVLLGISMLIGFVHLGQGKPLPQVLQRISQTCCEFAKGGDIRALLIVLGFTFASAGLFASYVGLVEMYNYLWKIHYQKWSREKHALSHPVVDFLVGEAPYKKCFQEINKWQERGLDNHILSYVY